MPYQDDRLKRQAYLAIFAQLLELGWDLPAKNAQALVDMPETDRTLEQWYLVTRYLRAMGYQGSIG